MKKYLRLLILCVLLCTVTGCSSNEETQGAENFSEGSLGIYYISNETLTLATEEYIPIEQDTEKLVKELYDILGQTPKTYHYKSAIPTEVELQSYKLDGEQLSLYFGDSYYNMDSITEALCRGAIVKTLMQLEGIEGIEFVVSNQPLMDKAGRTVGLMTKDTFMESKGSEINSYQETELRLYYSNAVGDGLVVVERKLLYNTNISMEKLIVEQLLKGIDGEENRNMAKASLPANTKLLNLYVKDGVCYVNFDENLLDQSVSVDEEIIIYSLVNSLTEIPTITKVQVSINGDSNRVFKENINLNTMFERNLEYVKD